MSIRGAAGAVRTPERVLDGHALGAVTPFAAKLKIQSAAGGSPDARLKHGMPAVRKLQLTGKFRVETPIDTNAIIARFQFTSGSIYIRSSGAVVESVPLSEGTRFTTHLPATTGTQKTWLDFSLNVDQVTGAFTVVVGSLSRSGTMETKRLTPTTSLVVLGPAEPSTKTASDLTLWLDDVIVRTPP